ncbi:MAG: hypothetical protein WC522_04345 [Candidatus Omnitrophota bacterium]
MRRAVALIVASGLLFAVVTGCAPTYPKEKVAESIVRLCKKEYKLDVKVATIGKTVAIYAPLADLWDPMFALTKHAGEELNDIILSISRVSLSTDADYKFYVVIAHDTRLPEIQIIIVKAVEDVKRFMLSDISRGEFSKRMLIDKRISPQAKKEHAIKEVFEKMGLDRKWQDAVMNDFFRSQPASLGDIGYWNGRFYVKDVSLPEFLAEQIAARIKMEFFEERKLADAVLIKSTRGEYVSLAGKSYFQIWVSAESKTFGQTGTPAMSNIIFKNSLDVIAAVLHGYRFENYEYIEITDEAAARSIKVTKEMLEDFRKKKLTFDNLLSQTG